MTKKIVLFAAVGRKPLGHRTEHQIAPNYSPIHFWQTPRLSTSSMLVFQDSLPRWSCWQRAPICMHYTLQCCRHQSTRAISDREGPDSRESWSAYMSKLAVQTSYATSSRFCSPGIEFKLNSFLNSGKTGRSEQFSLKCEWRGVNSIAFIPSFSNYFVVSTSQNKSVTQLDVFLLILCFYRFFGFDLWWNLGMFLCKN